jgi:hypothetical protein
MEQENTKTPAMLTSNKATEIQSLTKQQVTKKKIATKISSKQTKQKKQEIKYITKHTAHCTA